MNAITREIDTTSFTAGAPKAPSLSRLIVRGAGGPDKAVTLPGEEAEVMILP